MSKIIKKKFFFNSIFFYFFGFKIIDQMELEKIDKDRNDNLI
jgi:hypothetical protein